MNNTGIEKKQLPKFIPAKLSDFIFTKFEERKKRNSQYSLRSFARDLELSPGNLSDIIKGKLNISQRKACIVAERLALKDDETEFFFKLVEERNSNLYKHKQYGFETTYTILPDDIYSIFSNWYFFAIVELVRVSDFENDVNWISKRIGIQPEEARKAIETLKKVGLLEEVDRELKQTYDFFAPPDSIPSDAAKKLHKQVLHKAINAVDEQAIEERDFSSGFLRVRTSDLPAIQRK